MAKLTVVISAFNEEKNIEKCLRSLKFADEIVVVDNSSLDATADLARKYNAVVFTQKNNPKEIDLQKNFGFEKATNEWILSLDADEEVSPELAKEIGKVLDDSSSFLRNRDQRSKNQEPRTIDGYWIPRKNIIFGKLIRYTGWYPDPQLRLFKKGKAVFVKAHVHEPVKLTGESAYLKEHLIHHHYTSVSEFIHKTVTIYAPNEAQDYLDKGYEFSYFDAIKFPLNEFLSRFFARQGYRDGFHGLVLSFLMAFYHFVVFALIWEKRGFVEYEKEDFLNETEKEFKKAGRDIAFWLTKEKLASIKNPLKKTFEKITSKIRGL